LGTTSVSTTRIHARGLTEAKYSAASLISASVITFAMATIVPPYLRSPLFQSAIWRRK
jgi:hypothetical protein